jgi:hypothetical protein
VLKGGIDPGHTYQHRTPAAFFEHLQGDATGSVGGCNVNRGHGR